MQYHIQKNLDKTIACRIHHFFTMRTRIQQACVAFIILGLCFLHTPSLMAADTVQDDSINTIEVSANTSNVSKQKLPTLVFSEAQTEQSLVPYIEYLVDPSGMVNLQELFSPSYDNAFTPLKKGIPLTETGSTWLRLSIHPDSTETFVINLDSELASEVTLYTPDFNQYINNIEHFSLNASNPHELASTDIINKAKVTTPWQEFSMAHGKAIRLPTTTGPALLAQLHNHSLPIYIHMSGTPEPWFTPQLRTATDMAHDNSNLINMGITMMLAAVLALCLLRAFTEKGQWRVWTTIFTAALLVQSLIGLPTTPHGSIGLAGLPHVLAPSIALMLLPHIARHMLRNTKSSSKHASKLAPSLAADLDDTLDRDLDQQYRFLSIPCIFLAIAPLLPNMGWLGKILPLWPLLILFFLPTTIIALARKISGAKLFFFGCLSAIAGACCALIAMFMDLPATIINAIPLCGTAFGALLIAGLSRSRNSHNIIEKPKALKKHKTTIVIREDYDDPLAGETGLRLVSPDEMMEEMADTKFDDKANDVDGTIMHDAPQATRNTEIIPLNITALPEQAEANDAHSNDIITNATDNIAHTTHDDIFNKQQELGIQKPAQDDITIHSIEADDKNSTSPEMDIIAPKELNKKELDAEGVEHSVQEDVQAKASCAAPQSISQAIIKTAQIPTSDVSSMRASSLRASLEQEDMHALIRAEEAMRSPLESLRNSLKALEKCVLNPDTQKLCQEAAAASKQLEHVGEEFRRAAYRLPIEQESIVFDLQRCLRDAYDNVCTRSDAKNVALSWFMAPHLVQKYQGDANRLRTTLRMLMENAVDATDKGSVYLSARRVPDSTNPGHLLFTITDTGIGGPPERRKTSALMQAWELATSTGGSLSIDSGVHGTTISFSTRFLAIHSDNNHAPTIDSQRINACTSYGDHMLSSPSTSAKQGRIILGSPAVSNRQLLAFYLEDTAYFADEALSNLDIMAKYTSVGAELIILDGDMMEAEISKVITTIRQFEIENNVTEVPFLALVRDEKQADALLHMGCSQTLLKPVTRSGLCAQVALLAPLAMVPPVSQEDVEDHIDEHKAEPQEISGEIHSPVTPMAFTPDMDSAALATAIDLVSTSPQIQTSHDIAQDVIHTLEPVHTQDDNQERGQNAPKESAPSSEFIASPDTTQAPTVFEASADETIGDKATSIQDQHEFHGEDKPTSPVDTSSLTISSNHSLVPTSEAEDITLRIYEEYLQGGKSPVSPRMQALDPILFTDISPLEGYSANNADDKKTSGTKSTDTKNLPLEEEQKTSREQLPPISHLSSPSHTDVTDHIRDVADTENACNDGESVSAPRTIIKKVVQNHNTQESTVFVEHIQPKKAFLYPHSEGEVSQARPVSDIGASTQDKELPKAQTMRNTAQLNLMAESNEICVEEVTVGTEVLRLYKMPTTSLDLDAEYAAMLEREAKYLQDQEHQSQKNALVQEELPLEAHYNSVEEKAETEIRTEEPSQADSAMHSLIDPTVDSSLAPFIETGEMTAVATIIETVTDPILMEEPRNISEAVIEAEHVSYKDTIANDKQENTDTGTIAPIHTTQDQVLLLDDSIPNNYEGKNELDDPSENQEDKKPNAVVRVAEALLAVCTNLREPAPQRVKEKSLPSLRNLYKAFEANISDTTKASFEETQSIDKSNSKASDIGHVESAHDNDIDKAQDYEDMKQEQRFISIAQSVNEMAKNIKPSTSILHHSDKKDFVPQLISLMEKALHDANTAYEQDDIHNMLGAVSLIADNAEALGLRNLERHTRCVERAAMANDLDATRELYPDMENAVQRTINALRSVGLDGAHRA